MNIHSLQAVPARLAQVRAVMAREHLDAYIVLSSDPHLSEYPPARWQSRAFLSGFTGSAGTLIVTNDFAGVWVDSRYWTQAETQLAGSGAARMKITAQSAVPYLDWLLAHIPAGGTIGVDGGVLSLACAHTLLDACNARDIALRPIDLLEIDPALWPDRPPLPINPVFEHTLPYAGAPRGYSLQPGLHCACVDWPGIGHIIRCTGQNARAIGRITGCARSASCAI